MKHIDILLIGVGGYGDTYVRELLGDPKREGYTVVGAVDPYANSARNYELLRAANVPIFDRVEDFYRDHRADLAVISTPIPLHEPQAFCALQNGSDVLLEKPIAATPEAGRRIAEEAKRLGRRLAIGFQWCYDEAMLHLKSDFACGVLGKPLRLKAIVLWPRDLAYYARGTGWAGKKCDAQGNAIFDSIVSNATAHYLENMLWLTGQGFSGASITDLQVETWRANAIETYDTATLSARLDNGAELFFAASHALEPDQVHNPEFEYEFENAVVYYKSGADNTGELRATFRNGAVKSYGMSYPSNTGKIWVMLDALRGLCPIPCPAEAALRHADAVSQMREAQPEASVFPNAVRTETAVFVPGLAQRLELCYQRRVLLSQVKEAQV